MAIYEIKIPKEYSEMIKFHNKKVSQYNLLYKKLEAMKRIAENSYTECENSDISYSGIDDKFGKYEPYRQIVDMFPWDSIHDRMDELKSDIEEISDAIHEWEFTNNGFTAYNF